ncbi:MAG: hypothetical protein F6K28_47600 [Microcoleus sp. SIO2G3]|nr:hypothetical protein [Microcoleus sp. SIO2G3]
MLYFIAVWLVLGGVCAAVGLSLLNLLQARCFVRSSDRFIVAIWLGLLLMANLLLAVSTLVPLSPLVGATVFVGATELALLVRPTRIELQEYRCDRSGVVAIASVMVATAAITSRQVTWIDTGLYHYGVVQWLAQYGSVPGVALLFAHFGFTSAWFALAAPFDFGIFAARVSAVGNGFVLLLAIGHLLLAAQSIWQRQARLSDWFAIAFLGLTISLVLASSLLSDILVSPSPDLVVLFLTGIVAWTMLVITDAAQQKQIRAMQSHSAVALLLSAGAVTIKLIALPLLFVASCFG